MPPIRPDILSQYPPNGDAARAEMIAAIQAAPISYGPWRDLKSLYKRMESDPAADPAMLGAMIARLDRAVPETGRDATLVKTANVNNVNGLAAVGDRLAVVGGQYGYPDTLAVFDTTGPDPLKPPLLGTASVRGGTQVVACGPILCVATGLWGKPGLYLFTLDDAGQPVPRAQVEIDYDFNALDADYPYLYICAPGVRRRFGGLQIVDLSDPDHPLSLGNVRIPTAAGSAVNEAGTIAVVASTGSAFSWSSLPKPPSLRIVDVTDKRRPKETASVDVPGIRSGLIVGRYVYIGISAEGRTRQSGIQVVDISRPEHPVKDAFVPVGNYQIDGMKFYEGHLYAVDGGRETFALDLSQPDVPKVVGSTGASFTLSERAGGRVYASMPGGLRIIGIDDPAHPILLGSPPSVETIGYMKRRARRLLHRLAESSPERFVAVAAETLIGRGKASSRLDLREHWVRCDLLYGGSGRFRQTRHGRGGYVESKANGPSLRLRVRDERASDAWSRWPDQARRLLASADAPWQVHEMAVKVLRGAGTAGVPPLPSGTLASFLTSGSHLLASLASRQVAALCAEGRKVKPETAADAYFSAGVARRRVIGVSAARAAGDMAWATKFADRLLERIDPAKSDGTLTRRGRGALRLLAESLPGAGSAVRRLSLASVALSSRDERLRAWTEETLRALSNPEAIGAMRRLETLPEDLRDIALSALASGMVGREWDMQDAGHGIHDMSEFVRAGTWRLLRASATTPETLRDLWLGLIESRSANPALATAMRSVDALALLSRSGIEVTAVVESMKTRPFLVGLLQPETFRIVTQSAPMDLTLALIAAMDDDLWARLRPAWRDNLREGIGVTDLWLLAGNAIREDASGRLEGRLLGDEEIARTFFDIDNADAILEMSEPAFSELLARWAHLHADAFPRDSERLLLAATHALPDLRAWALARVESVGMEAPFALRLLESEVPPSVRFARAWFDAAGGNRAADLALALCDSPSKSVRGYGREYIAARRDSLPMDRIVTALTEHSDPTMQEFVASLLRESVSDRRVAERFDRTVLRARDRGRRAKEMVKARPDAAAGMDMATLLEVARGRTPRDAEWALAEIARRTVAGEVVEGVTREGAAGI